MVLTMRISTIIPTYNNASFLKEAIDSVLAQTHPAHEIIVVDDGSTDDTGAVVQAYPQVKYIKKENGGPNSARNAGLAQATGELVAFLDADDRWEPVKLEKQIQLFEQNPALGLVYANYKNIGTDGMDRPDIPTVPIDPQMRGNVFARLLERNMILGSSSNVLIKKSVFDAVGVFDETLRVGEDWDMWLRIAEQFPIDYINEVLVAIRRHMQNQTNNILHLIKQDCVFIEKWLPAIDGIYPIPPLWGDKIIFNIIRRLPRLDGFSIAKKSLSTTSRKKLFSHAKGLIVLACMSSLIHVLSTPDLRKRAFAALKRYG